MEFSFPLGEFLSNLKINSAPSVSEAGLHSLHRAHCFTIPFENVEPRLGRPVPLSLEALCEKILHKKRGGYCFELNSFFLSALRELGFKARPVLGRVFMGRPIGGPRTHLASLVSVAGREFLADVGFGGAGLTDAIPFEPGFETLQHGRKIRLRADSRWGMVYEDEFEGDWRSIYAIPQEEVLPIDLETGNHYCATHPDSIFRKSLFCALPTPEGRVTVWNRSVHIFTGTQRQEKIMESTHDFRWLFHDVLKLALSESDLVALDREIAPHATVSAP